MNKPANKKKAIQVASTEALFGRVVEILDRARGHVARSVNQTTVVAYWLIGREIVEALQGGDDRAKYGKTLLEKLAVRLTERYGKGFSSTNLRYFRNFYTIYAERIRHPVGGEFEMNKFCDPVMGDSSSCFHPNLGWSHYRALMRVSDPKAREFYETEAVRANWSRRDLERQIHSLFYERTLASKDKVAMLASAKLGNSSPIKPLDVLKDPYILEFLDLPDSPPLHENQVEQAIIDKLQRFLLELGRGFSFVARQQRLRFDDKDFYVDLVFYNYLLKCFVLIDLKIGELGHQDIGQMDGYVRMYEEQYKVEGDNPTIGLILCSEKNAAVARYSVLHESEQLFASRYRVTLPSEEELQSELRRARAILDERMVAD
ncbi:MAG: PDDEXK nuclease domain-containing protein [Azoarcus sp.]|jgi:predicted nuclease of restriction endonuclease-like (RecB) superfamily|nr:PDDEXK nuclease domain-containing protein [Azoarcus sp.]